MMNIATTKGSARSSLSLPNILTYGRIAAIPVVVGCVFLQSIMFYPLWLRWVALAVFLAAAITDYLDGYYARIWISSRRSAGCWIRSRTSCW
jgi:cardiolipin synthase (CMP-forming)